MTSKHLRDTSALLIAVATTLTACTSGAGTAVTPAAHSYSTNSITRILSPAITGAERTYMIAKLASIPEEYRRGQVFVFDQQGRVHVSDPAMLSGIKFWKNVPGHPYWAEDASGELLIRPEAQVKPNVTNCGGAGYCHRRYSEPTFNYVTAGVAFQCSSVGLVDRPNHPDQGYAYVGVHDTASPPTATEVDAGVQVTGHPVDNQPISIQAYIHAAVGTITYTPPGKHFACDPSLTLSYQPNSPSEGMLVVNGLLTDGGSQVTGLADGISAPAPCPTCQVKRITSLTTPISSPDGSYWGVAFPTTAPVPTIAWSNSMHGQVRQYGIVSNKGLFYETTEPGNVLGSPPLILCTGVQPPPPNGNGSANETIGINYTPNAPSGPGCSQ